MKTIYKYKLDIADRQKITVSKTYQVLTIQYQNEYPCLWVLVDTDQIDNHEYAELQICIFGTGHSTNVHDLKYINTFQLLNGNLIFHAFYKEVN